MCIDDCITSIFHTKDEFCSCSKLGFLSFSQLTHSVNNIDAKLSIQNKLETFLDFFFIKNDKLLQKQTLRKTIVNIKHFLKVFLLT